MKIPPGEVPGGRMSAVLNGQFSYDVFLAAFFSAFLAALACCLAALADSFEALQAVAQLPVHLPHSDLATAQQAVLSFALSSPARNPGSSANAINAVSRISFFMGVITAKCVAARQADSGVISGGAQGR
jgi:hypothetical protein